MAKDAVFSLRVTSSEARRWREFAQQARLSVSELLRAAMNRLTAPADRLDEITAPTPKARGWTCQHYTITAPPGVLGTFSTECGCQMQPIY